MAGIYVRRHTKYADPCDDVIERWRIQVVGDALARERESDLMRVIGRLERQSDQIRNYAAFAQLLVTGKSDSLACVTARAIELTGISGAHRPERNSRGRAEGQGAAAVCSCGSNGSAGWSGGMVAAACLQTAVTGAQPGLASRARRTPSGSRAMTVR